jgi:hypothetical protein
MEAKKEQDNKLKTEYDKFMFKYLQRGEMQEIPDDQLYAKGVYYIPHHAILREASLTTKLRVVFDANCRSSTGSSLNQASKIGRTHQPLLMYLVMQFRTF